VSYNVQKLDNSAVEIKITLAGEEIKGYKSQAIAKIKKDVEIKGFRKGKAPVSAIEGQFADLIKEEVTERVLNKHYETLLTENDIKPVNYMNPKEIKLEEDKFEGTFVVDVYPEFTVENYKGIEATKETFEMKDEVLDREIEIMLESKATLVDAPEGTKAETWDTLDLNFEGFVDGVAFDGGKAEHHSLKLGSKSFIDTFEDQLVGYEAGQEGEVNVTFPEAYHAENLAGKPAMFKVKVNAIKKLEKPELTEEFAKEAGFESVEDLKAKKYEEVKTREENRVESAYRQAILEKLVEGTEITLPKSFVDREIQNRIAEMENQLKMQGLSMEMYLQMSGADMNTMVEQIRPQATNKVKLDLILGQISEKESIEVSDEELEVKATEVAKMYNMDLEGLKAELNKANNLDNFMSNLRVDTTMTKAVDFVVENAK